MKLAKRISALLLALVMALSLSTMAFADEATTTTPVTRTTVSSIDGVSSITIGGTTAYYEKDSNTGDQIYIRAMVNSSSEYALKTTTVVLNLANENTTVSGDIAFTGTGTTRTATVNLLNTVYSVTIGTTTYKLAAGLPSGVVSIDSNDPLRIATLRLANVDATITATNAQNPCMGNTTVNTDGKWTFVSYKANATSSATIADRTAVAARIKLASGTSASGGCLGTTVVSGGNSTKSATLNLQTLSPYMNITANGETRKYYIFVTDPGTFTVKYGIDFTEAMGDTTHYTGTVKTAVDTLYAQAKEYFGVAENQTCGAYGEIVVNSGETVMDIMRKFAVAYNYTSEVPVGCTYMATLNGIGEFTFGNASGWMYTDGPSWNSDGKADYTKWNTPAVGGASYTLSANDTICWFICCNYMHHPWG